MQTKKLSLANMHGKLSRTEMKNIMAGSGTNACSGLSENDCRLRPLCENSGAAGKCGWTVAWNRCTCASS